MNATCSECGMGFARGEPGYFVGAMYFSYALGLAVGVPTFLALLFLARVPYEWCVALTGLELVLLSPIVFRYSRVIWLHFDQSLGNW